MGKKDDEKGLPLGFRFPFAQYEEWTKCVNELAKQGYKIVKDGA